MYLAGGFMPHGHCLFWEPGLLALHVASDGLTALAYFSIPWLLFRLVQQRKDVPFQNLFHLFAAFIMACGTTHLMAIWTMWSPDYWLEGWVKAATGIVSAVTAVVLHRNYRAILAIPSPEELQAEIDRRLAAERVLEEQVKSRTRELGVTRQEAERHRLLLDETLIGLPAAVVVADASGPIHLANPQARKLLGLSEGANWQEVELRNQAGEVVGQDLFSVETTELAVVVGGRHLTCSSRLTDGAGVAVFNDVTAQKTIEEELRLSNQELKMFGHAASHDLKEPLRGIHGCLSILERRLDLEGEREKHLFELVKGSAARMQAMIEGLLRYSQLGRHRAEVEPVQVATVVGDALKDLRVLLEESAAEVELGELGQTEADPTLLRQLYANLIANAVKFRHKDRPCRVSLGRPDDAFFVKDNGIGIDPTQFDRIFLLFQRLHAADAYPGTGLGLAVCKNVVDRHGGRIWVESAPGEGTTMWFTLKPGPAAQSETEPG
ncbi:MAG: ATP-binding protein [Vulcanimicrobiota bacterium]